MQRQTWAQVAARLPVKKHPSQSEPFFASCCVGPLRGGSQAISSLRIADIISNALTSSEGEDVDQQAPASLRPKKEEDGCGCVGSSVQLQQRLTVVAVDDVDRQQRSHAYCYIDDQRYNKTSDSTIEHQQQQPPYHRSSKRRKSENSPSASLVSLREVAMSEVSSNAISEATAARFASTDEKAVETNNGTHLILNSETVASEATSATAASSSSSTSGEEEAKGDEDLAPDADAAYLAELAQQQQTFAFSQIARQLEYYFSQQNLSKDTYVQTLRNLNDGCVPVTILANFAKVKLIMPLVDEETRLCAILQAATEYSDFLIVNSIDTATGKITTDDTPSSATTILAVGPIHNQPLDLSSPEMQQHRLERQTSQDSGEVVSNVVILRDVQPQVTQEEVHGLFAFEGCPQVHSIYADVGCSWFITLETDSRQEMMKVMMHVRSQALAGEYVQARLKATAKTYDAAVPAAVLTTPMLCWGGEPIVPALDQASNSKNSKRKKKRNKKKKGGKQSSSNKPKQNQQTQQQASEQAPELEPTQPHQRRHQAAKKSEKRESAPAPPSLGEEDFPSLGDKKVEWETPPCIWPRGPEPETETEEKNDEAVEEEDEGSESVAPKDAALLTSTKSLGYSDAASTATTTSSSAEEMSSSGGSSYAATVSKPVLGGYAAAVLKAAALPAPVKVHSPKTSGTARSDSLGPKPASSSETKTEAPRSQEPSVSKLMAPAKALAPAPVKIHVAPPSWGHGRSFADILRAC